MKKVGVVILNYKVADQAISCLKSVLKSDYQNFEVVVVDNNSGDNLQEQMSQFPAVEFIQTGDNLGYSGGNNVGIKRVLEKGVDLVWVLNPDTTVLENTLSVMVDSLIKDQVGVLGPKIYFKDSKVIWYAGGQLDLANVLGGHRGVDQTDNGEFDQAGETDYVTGASMLVDRAVYEKIGFFDDRYFLYYEDSDFCYRAKLAGFKIFYQPKAVVYHANAQSTGLGSPRQDYYITRNRLLFGSKFLSLRTRFALVREAIKHLGMPIRRRAFFDWLFGKFGNANI